MYEVLSNRAPLLVLVVLVAEMLGTRNCGLCMMFSLCFPLRQGVTKDRRKHMNTRMAGR